MPKAGDHPIPISLCPSCGYTVDHANGAFHNNAPKVGDISICIACGQLLFFDSQMRIRLPTTQEIEKLTKTERQIIARVVVAINSMPPELRDALRRKKGPAQ